MHRNAQTYMYRHACAITMTHTHLQVKRQELTLYRRRLISAYCFDEILMPQHNATITTVAHTCFHHTLLAHRHTIAQAMQACACVFACVCECMWVHVRVCCAYTNNLLHRNMCNPRHTACMCAKASTHACDACAACTQISIDRGSGNVLPACSRVHQGMHSLHQSCCCSAAPLTPKLGLRY